MGYHHIKYEVADEIATITFNRPEARNALSAEMREDISNALEDIKERAGAFLDIFERIADVFAHFCAECISRFGAVERNCRDLVSDLVFDVVIAHNAVSFIRHILLQLK